jgi:peptidoglycan biosynthesis protein MviN/MurJ (putative lipid II flippase)
MTHSLVTIVAMAAFAFWLAQLIELFTLNVSYFESHTHKLVWFLVIFTGNIVGAIWFFVWKRRRQPRP